MTKHFTSSSLLRVGLAMILFSASGLAMVSAAEILEDQATDSSAFGAILGHYEAIRMALTQDTVGGTAEHVREIQQVIENLQGDWQPERAGVQADKSEEAKDLLLELQQAAKGMASASSIEPMRDAFYAFSKPLVRWRKIAAGELPVVAYCPMARRSWLQPKGDIENPYHGQSMLRCGEVVDG